MNRAGALSTSPYFTNRLFFAFPTTAYMSSFLFLHFCDNALRLLGLYFSTFHSFRIFLRWLFTAAVQTSTEALHASNRAGLGLRWCRSPARPPKPHTGPHRGKFAFFSPKRTYPSPFRGRGWVSAFLGWAGWPCSFTTGSRWLNRAALLLRWCLFPTWLSKSHTGPHRAEFGLHRFFLVRFGLGRVDKSFSSL